MESITFRRVARDDFELIGEWLARPHVRRWWVHEFSPDAIERDFGPSVDGTEPGEDYLVMLDGRAIGLMQYSRFEDYPEYREELKPLIEVPDGAVSIDYLIGDPDHTGRGVGTRMVAAFAAHVWARDPGVGPIIVPVSSANEASWRALLAAGFRKVARGELEPDNPIDDRSHEILRLNRPDAGEDGRRSE